MAKMDNAVIARRQRDLDGYTENYLDRLDRMTAQHSKDLAKHWVNMEKQIKQQIKQLYDDADAVYDNKKLDTLSNKIARLEALQAQLQEDIRLSNAKQQPFTTSILKNQFEDSYYFSSYGLEQAARVVATIPILTPAQVLGVLANPWLGDGANYSQRLNANMAHFASNIRNSVATAVNGGWGWNETAREIKRLTQESYFNSVRLARTELTRAAAQGASYSYMQNADILDGKRWNATKDSRTAPKDAANDGKIYDLDYDTMENKGVPGQRIPNHPHCRCLWSPVLSALGVQDKERIARGDGDTPTSWGKNYYTKAATYRDYAKERGLPDLDERLAKDKPSRYLRPGETAADLNRAVKRWAYGGATIAIATPDWKAIKDDPSTTMPTGDEIAAGIDKIPKDLQDVYDYNGEFSYSKYLIKASTIKDPDEYYDYAMRVTDQLLKPMIGKPGRAALAAPIKYVEENGVIKMIRSSGITTEISKEHLNLIIEFNHAGTVEQQTAVYEKINAMLAKCTTPREVIPTQKLKTEIRGAIDLTTKAANNEMLKDLKLYEQVLTATEKADLTIVPQKNVRAPALKQAIEDANNWLTKYQHPQNVTMTGLKLDTLPKGGRAYAYGSSGNICLPTDTSASVAVHEASHCIHDQSKRIRQLTNTFFDRRTKGYVLTTIYKGTSEKGYKDNFISHYVGRVYSWEKAENKGQEVISMGMQYMYDDPKSFYIKDPGHFKLIYAILRGLQ